MNSCSLPDSLFQIRFVACYLVISCTPGHVSLVFFPHVQQKEDKDKREKDKEKGKHQFVGVSFSNSTKCDYCEKSLANRDSLQCTGW